MIFQPNKNFLVLKIKKKKAPVFHPLPPFRKKIIIFFINSKIPISRFSGQRKSFYSDKKNKKHNFPPNEKISYTYPKKSNQRSRTANKIKFKKYFIFTKKAILRLKKKEL